MDGKAAEAPASTGDSTRFTQKEVLLLAQKVQFEKKTISLPSANWSGLDLRGINLKNADLRFANLSGSSFVGAEFDGAKLRYANLKGADFSHAKFANADLTDAAAEGAKWDGASGVAVIYKGKLGIPLSKEEEARLNKDKGKAATPKRSESKDGGEKKEDKDKKKDDKEKGQEKG